MAYQFALQTYRCDAHFGPVVPSWCHGCLPHAAVPALADRLRRASESARADSGTSFVASDLPGHGWGRFRDRHRTTRDRSSTFLGFPVAARGVLPAEGSNAVTDW